MGLPRSNLVKPKSTPVSTPPPASGVRALEVAPTVPQLTPFAPAPASASVDVVVDPFEVTAADAIPDHAPSTHDLLERAARLGPPRMTFESIVLPNDPVLAEKMQPHAAERRARFRKIVKATVGACVALCLAAIVASALSGGEASASTGSSDGSGVTRTAPATRVVSIEKLDDAKRGKAITQHVAASTANARAKTPKRR